MLFEITELGQHVWISAFSERPEDVEQVLRSMQKRFPEVSVQLVDLDRVAGSRYLFLATFNALTCFRSKQPITRSLGMEILLYVAANRQIGEALKHVGVTSGTRKVAVLAVGRSRDQILGAAAALRELLKAQDLDTLVDEWNSERIGNVRSLFGIGDKEIKAIARKNEDLSKTVERLAIERSAMLTVKR